MMTTRPRKSEKLQGSAIGREHGEIRRSITHAQAHRHLGLDEHLHPKFLALRRQPGLTTGLTFARRHICKHNIFEIVTGNHCSRQLRPPTCRRQPKSGQYGVEFRGVEIRHGQDASLFNVYRRLIDCVPVVNGLRGQHPIFEIAIQGGALIQPRAWLTQYAQDDFGVSPTLLPFGRCHRHRSDHGNDGASRHGLGHRGGSWGHICSGCHFPPGGTSSKKCDQQQEQYCLASPATQGKVTSAVEIVTGVRSAPA